MYLKVLFGRGILEVYWNFRVFIVFKEVRFESFLEWVEIE